MPPFVRVIFAKQQFAPWMSVTSNRRLWFKQDSVQKFDLLKGIHSTPLISGIYQSNFHIKWIITLQNLNVFPRGGQWLRLKMQFLNMSKCERNPQGEPNGINRKTWQPCHHTVNKARGLKECKLAVDVSADKRCNNSSVWSYCCPLKETWASKHLKKNT